MELAKGIGRLMLPRTECESRQNFLGVGEAVVERLFLGTCTKCGCPICIHSRYAALSVSSCEYICAMCTCHHPAVGSFGGCAWVFRRGTLESTKGSLLVETGFCGVNQLSSQLVFACASLSPGMKIAIPEGFLWCDVLLDPARRTKLIKTETCPLDPEQTPLCG